MLSNAAVTKIEEIVLRDEDARRNWHIALFMASSVLIFATFEAQVSRWTYVFHKEKYSEFSFHVNTIRVARRAIIFSGHVDGKPFSKLGRLIASCTKDDMRAVHRKKKVLELPVLFAPKLRDRNVIIFKNELAMLHVKLKGTTFSSALFYSLIRIAPLTIVVLWIPIKKVVLRFQREEKNEK